MSDRGRRRPTRVLATLTVVAAVIVAVFLLDDNVSTDPAAETESTRSVSAEEFCAAFEKLNLAHGANLTSPSSQATRQLKDAAAELAELVDGTDMPEEARAGARFIVSLILELDDVATVGEINTFDEQATLRDTANAKALGAHVADTCVPAAPTNPK